MLAMRGTTTVSSSLYSRNDTVAASVATLRASIKTWINEQWNWTPPVPSPDSSSVPTPTALRHKVGNKVVDISRKINRPYRHTKVTAEKLKLPKSAYKVWGRGFNKGKKVEAVYLKAQYGVDRPWVCPDFG